MRTRNLIQRLGIPIVLAGALLSPYQARADESSKLNKDKISYIARDSDFSQDSDETLLARMLFGEARSCSLQEKIHIAYTAINRTRDGKKWNGENLREVILCPKQYSCFNDGDPNLPKLRDPLKCDKEQWKECLQVASFVIAYRQ